VSCCLKKRTNAEVEENYFNDFLNRAGYEPKNIIHQPEHEQPPDFIIELGGQRIGIELTEFHSQAKGAQVYTRRQIEEEWRKFQHCHLMPEVRNVPHLKTYNGLLFFKKLTLPPRSKYSAFVSEIVQFSPKHCNLNKGEEKSFNCFGPEFQLMNNYLQELHLRNVGFEMTWEWGHNFGSVGPNEDELINIIKRKINGLNKSGWNSLSEKWLLVVSGHRPSQWIGHSSLQLESGLPGFKELNLLLHKSGLDKIFIFPKMFNLDNSIFLFENNNWKQI
jgi:hypothetical protein